MKKPIDKHKNPDDTSRLFFDNDGDWHDYYMRGGICWPSIESPGYVIVGGQDIVTSKITIFEAMEFLTVNNILGHKDEAKADYEYAPGDESMVKHKGVAYFFNDCWSRYFARRYYWHQRDELHKMHRLEVVRSKDLINPQPIMIEIPWPDEKDVRGIIWKFHARGWIKMQKESDLALAVLEARQGADITPPVHALQCLLAGIERHPWRKRK